MKKVLWSLLVGLVGCGAVPPVEETTGESEQAVAQVTYLTPRFNYVQNTWFPSPSLLTETVTPCPGTLDPAFGFWDAQGCQRGFFCPNADVNQWRCVSDPPDHSVDNYISHSAATHPIDYSYFLVNSLSSTICGTNPIGRKISSITSLDVTVKWQAYGHAGTQSGVSLALGVSTAGLLFNIVNQYVGDVFITAGATFPAPEFTSTINLAHPPGGGNWTVSEFCDPQNLLMVGIAGGDPQNVQVVESLALRPHYNTL